MVKQTTSSAVAGQKPTAGDRQPGGAGGEPAASLETVDRLLDVAERMFAEQGIDRVSVRAVQAAAGANVAAVHYHFGSRQQLIRAVVRRRVEPLSAERLQRLAQVESAHPQGPLPLEDVLRAFIGPVFELSARLPHVGWLLAHLQVAADDSLRADFYELFAPLIERYGRALARAVPADLPPDAAWCRVQFTWGAMIHTLSRERRNRTLGPGVALPPELTGTDLIEQWVAFCAAGLRAPFHGSLTGTSAPARASSPVDEPFPAERKGIEP